MLTVTKEAVRLCQKRKRVVIVTLVGTESFVIKVGIDHNHIKWISCTVLMTFISSLIVNCLSIINLEVEVLTKIIPVFTFNL